MLVGWHTFYSEDEKMGAELVPSSWSWLGVGSSMGDTHLSVEDTWL